MEHNSMFLMPLWRTIGKSRWLITARNLPKTLVISGLILGTLLALVLVRKDFELEARGSLLPVIRQNVFFGVNGDVDEVKVGHGASVKQGDLLITLKNNELEQEITRLRYDHLSAQDALRAIDRRLEKGDPNGTLYPQVVELRQRIIGLRAQLLILEDKKQKLNVTSPIDGHVTTWNIQETLRDRPVTVGQLALEVADPNGPWELEVKLRDDRMGHLVKAQLKEGTQSLPVSFIMKSHSGEQFEGTLREIQETASVDGEHGHSYRLRVEIDKDKIQQTLKQDELNQGAEVIAKVRCGRRSAAYCFFHELLEWLQTRLFAL